MSEESGWEEFHGRKAEAERLAKRLSRWFERGVVDGLARNPRPIAPGTPDVQGDTGPRPHSDEAYASGFRIGEAMKGGD